MKRIHELGSFVGHAGSPSKCVECDKIPKDDMLDMLTRSSLAMLAIFVDALAQLLLVS